MKKRKGCLRLGILCFLTIVLFMSASCNKEKKEETPNEIPDPETAEGQQEKLALEETGVLLEQGESYQLEAAGAAASYISSNEEVATVDSGGKITAVGKGNAFITVSSGEQTTHFGVIVGLEQGEPVDIRQTVPERIVSEQFLSRTSVLRDFVVVNGEIYYIQRNDSEPSDLVLQHLDQAGNVDEWMIFSGFGGGVSISAETGENGKWYVWLESNGNAGSEGQTISRIPYEPGTSYQGQGGQTWYFNQTEGAAYPSVDQKNGLVCVRTVSSGGYTFTYYDLKAMVSGEELIPLYEVELDMLTGSLESEVNPSGSAVGEFTFRGFAASGSYIYQYYGKAESTLLLAVYDMRGKAVYVHKVNEYPDLVFREPDGMYLADGKLYLGVTTGESGDRRANIFLYQ